MMKLTSKLELKKRDLSLFSYLHSCKIASTNQINRDQFKRSLVTTRKRLAKLRDYGLIEYVFKGIEYSKPNAYSLTTTGFGYLKKYYPEKFLIERIKSNSCVHDLKLVDLKNVITSKKLVTKFWSENDIQTNNLFVEDYELSIFRVLQVDGLIKLDNEKGDVLLCAIEYEATSKSQSRYVSKLKQYYANPGVQIVLFISEKQEVEDVVKNIELREFKLDQKKIYYALFDDLISSKEKLTFRSQDGLRLEIS